MVADAFRRLLPGVLAALVLAALLPATAAAATRPTRFDLYLGSSCIGGVSSDGALVEVIWRRASGKLVLHESLPASSNGGYWEACAGDGFSTPLLKVGDRLEARVGGSTRRFTVPALTLRFDRANDAFFGRAPADTFIRLSFPDGIFADYEVSRRVDVDSDGRWRHAEPHFDLMGGQYAYLRWRSAKEDRVTLDGIAPFLRLTLGDARFSGTFYAGSSFRARLHDPSSGALLASGKAVADRHGAFDAVFRDSSGQEVAATAGNRLSAPGLAADASWIVPRVNARADAATDEVSGRCFDAGSSAGLYDIRVFTPAGDHRARSMGSTDSFGRFSVDMGDEVGGMWHSPGDLQPGDTVVVGCLQQTGDWAQREIIVP